jgi:hypothetical protein
MAPTKLAFSGLLPAPRRRCAAALWIGALALGSLAAGACGERDSSLERSIDLMDAPIALSGELVFIDRNDRAFLLDVSGSELSAEAQVVALPHAPKLATRRNGKGKGEVLVLTGGRRASDSEKAEPATLTAIEHNGSVRKYTLGNPFDRMQQSEDGRYVFMFKSGSSERLLDNPNEIAIVDLSKPPRDKDAINLRTLRSFEDAPLSVVYSPPMSLLGETRRLAIVLSHSNVTLIDLDHLARRETTVQLSGINDKQVEPAQVAFDPVLPKLYVRGAASNDVFVFNLSARPGGTVDPDGSKEEHNDFRPSIDQLGVGALPSDMALYDSPNGTRLLVLSAESMQASIVSATAVTDVPLDARAGQVLVFDAPSPRDRNSAPRALLYDGNGSTLQFLDLSDIEERGKRNLEVVDLPSPIVKLVAMPGEQRVLVLHDEGVSLVDLAGRTVSPLSSDRKLEDAEFDAARHRLWVGPGGQSFVGWLDLETGDTHELLLDESISTLTPMFEDGHVAIVHPSSVGYVTLLDANKPTRESARSVRGFLIAGLLDRGE